MSFDFQKIAESKDAHRRMLAALPIGEKLRLLDGMRERTVAIRGSHLAEPMSPRLREEPEEYRASKNLPPPFGLAAEIVESLEAALEEFRGVEEALAGPVPE